MLFCLRRGDVNKGLKKGHLIVLKPINIEAVEKKNHKLII